jgi:hypothetical protein
MQEDRRSSNARSPTTLSQLSGSQIAPSILEEALTPRGLFTNLFPVTLSGTSLGTLRQSTKAKKEEFSDRRRPSFYQSGEVLYAYGPGGDDFKDARFTPAIVSIDKEPGFTQYLLRLGLADFFRSKSYLVRFRRVGISIIDHHELIASAESGFLHIYPEYSFQSYRLEGADGAPIFAVAIEAAWATVPVFEIGKRLAGHPEYLKSLKLLLECSECGPHCPVYDRQNKVVGVFDSFADDNTELTSACTCENYTPQAVLVRQRIPRKGKKIKSRGAVRQEERMIVLPGQVLRPASGQRRVLRLFHDRDKLEFEGRIWLGDLSRDHKVRSGALKVRYQRIQRFLGRVAGHDSGGISFSIATGPSVILERVPVTVEELSDV